MYNNTSFHFFDRVSFTIEVCNCRPLGWHESICNQYIGCIYHSKFYEMYMYVVLNTFNELAYIAGSTMVLKQNGHPFADNIQMHFIRWFLLILYSNLPKICCWRSSWQWLSIGVWICLQQVRVYYSMVMCVKQTNWLKIKFGEQFSLCIHTH